MAKSTKFSSLLPTVRKRRKLSLSRRMRLFGNLAMGAALAATGCEPAADIDEKGLGTLQSPVGAYNGQGWNGQGWNGIEWNGQGWNGQGWNGQGWNGQGWNGQGWNGQGWNGIGWNGQGWNGQGWNGQGWNGQGWNGQGWNGVPGQDSPMFTTLHNWINHTDVDGNGIPSQSKLNLCGPPGVYDPSYLNDTKDMMVRVQSLAYWASCACPSSVEIPINDTHGRFSMTLYGALGLAPIWCGSDPNAEVPESEMQIVSACLLARVNVKGKHFPLSLRSKESGTEVTTNERLTHRLPLSWYFGNLWKLPHADNDTTTVPSANLANSGGSWWNMERFSCAVATGEDLMSDQALFGRTCDGSDCEGHIEHLGECESGRKKLGELDSWDPDSQKAKYYKAVTTHPFEPVVNGGLGSTKVILNKYQPFHGGTTTSSATYRGRSWRAMTLYRPSAIGFEESLPVAIENFGSYAWSKWEVGNPAQQVIWCGSEEADRCEGAAQGDARGRKLLGLPKDQAITINLTGNKESPWNINGDGTQPVSLAIRYSRPKLLGDGQCDPDGGCLQTTWWQCASGSLGINGCIGGAADFGKLRIWVMSNKQQNPNWTFIHGAGSPYGKNIFPPTYAENKWAIAYIYPIYPQDSYTTISGAVDHTPGVTYDTLRTWFSGETSSYLDSPQLDTAYYLTGPPPADADCKGVQGCWLFAGPNQYVSLSQGEETSYTSPYLPPGNYKFRIDTSAGDPDLYVKANAPAAVNNWDCRPYAGIGVDETCTITLTGRGGYISAMVRGYSSTLATATLIGNN